MMQPKILLYTALALLLACVLYLTWLWQPARQVERHQANLLKALSDRNWMKAATFFDPSYADRWGHNKESVLQDCRVALAQFFALEVRPENLAITVADGRGTVSVRITLQGSGTEVANLVMQRANQLTTPFVFEWRKSGPKPWEWQLVRVDNAGLEFHGFDF